MSRVRFISILLPEGCSLFPRDHRGLRDYAKSLKKKKTIRFGGIFFINYTLKHSRTGDECIIDPRVALISGRDADWRGFADN